MKLQSVVALSALSGVSAMGVTPVWKEAEVTVGEVQMKMYPALFSDYEGAEDCSDDSMMTLQSSCWEDAEEGVYYRYGCADGDIKVYTDACSDSDCNPASCTNEWFYEGEEHDVCYDDGTVMYAYTCGFPGVEIPQMPVVEEPEPVDPVAVPPPKACCMAMTAECLACAEDMTAESYCNAPGTFPRAPDCDQYFNCRTREIHNPPKKKYCAASMASATAPPTTPPVDPVPQPKACCMAMTVECLACSADLTPSEYCNFPNASPMAVNCDEYFNCKTKEMFNDAKQAYCFPAEEEEEVVVEEEVEEVPTTLPAVVEAPVSPSAKSCAELGWDMVGNVCAESKINKECSGAVSYSEAYAFCDSVGARLCSLSELEGDVAKETGCKADSEVVWSQSSCPDGKYTAAGASKYSNDVPSTCSSMTTSAVARCCADAVGGGSSSGSASLYPLGYTEAFSSDYPLSDGYCGKSAPTQTYSCWTNPATGRSQRYGCRSGTSLSTIYIQDCGMDSTCSTCTGAFVPNMESKGRCYRGTTSVYDYSCGN